MKITFKLLIKLSEEEKMIQMSANSTKWSNTFKQLVDKRRRIVWVSLTILWGGALRVN